jgi:hypothetical protein
MFVVQKMHCLRWWVVEDVGEVWVRCSVSALLIGKRWSLATMVFRWQLGSVLPIVDYFIFSVLHHVLPAAALPLSFLIDVIIIIIILSSAAYLRLPFGYIIFVMLPC